MPIIDFNQGDALIAITARLRTALSLNERTCFESISPEIAPAHWMGDEDNVQLLVGCGEGTFDPALFHGGGGNQTMEAWQVIVGCYSRIHLDESGHDHEALVAARRGVLRVKHEVIRALKDTLLTTTGEVVTDISTQTAWLREMIRPVSASRPQHTQAAIHKQDGSVEPGPGAMQVIIGFSVPFDWDFS